MIDQLIQQIYTNHPYNRHSHRIRIDIDVTDVGNTYGFKTIINCYLIETRSICEHCRDLRGSHNKICLVGDLHNFKQLPVVINVSSGETVEKALINMIDLIEKNDQRLPTQVP